MYYCTMKEYRKKQDGSLVRRTRSFRGEQAYRQLFIHKLCDSLGYSNHKQFFLFKAFCFHNFSTPLKNPGCTPGCNPNK